MLGPACSLLGPACSLLGPACSLLGPACSLLGPAHSNKGTSGAMDSGEHSRIAFRQLQQATLHFVAREMGVLQSMMLVQLKGASIYGADGA